MSPESSTSVDLADYLSVISRHRVMILAFTFAFAFAAFLYAESKSAQFTTGSQLQFAEAPDSAAQNPKVLQAYVQDEAAFLRSTTVATEAARLLSYDGDPRGLVRDLSIVVPVDGRVVTVRYTAPTAADAQSGAEAFTRAYVNLRTSEAETERDRVVKGADTKIKGLEAQLTALEEQLGDGRCNAVTGNVSLCTATNVNYQKVSDQLTEARVERQDAASSPIDAGEILSPAPIPKGPSTPSTTRTVALGALAGLLVGLVAAFIRDRLDVRVRDKEDIEAALDLVPLASIPVFAERFRTRSAALVTIHAPDTPEADAFRRLRASVLIALHGLDDARVLGITSANAGEGKSTVSANLAVTLSQAGHSVAVLSADIRRPSLEELFSLPTGEGLGEVLEGRSTIDAATHVVSSSLAVVRSGTALGNPTDLLLSPRMKSVIEALREQFDYVVVDTPPVLAVADTLGMVPNVQAMALVVSLADTTGAEATEAEEQLRRVGARLVGAVINRSAPMGERYYGYRSS